MMGSNHGTPPEAEWAISWKDSPGHRTPPFTCRGGWWDT